MEGIILIIGIIVFVFLCFMADEYENRECKEKNFCPVCRKGNYRVGCVYCEFTGRWDVYSKRREQLEDGDYY